MRKSISYRILLYLLISALIFPVFLLPGFAHSGRTDSSGGHRDNKNASGLGSYHYHHGYSAHLHPGGVCPYDAPKTIPKDTIKIDNQPSSMTVGDSISLGWTVTYYSGNSDVSWSSSDTSVLSATGGTLTAVSPGTATVTAKLYNGSKSFKVKVNPVYATSIELSILSDRLEMTRSVTVSGNVLPWNATHRDISWTSSNSSVATIDENGVIMPVAPGTVTITASNKDGIKNTLSLEVFEILPEKITVSETQLSLPYQAKGSITAKVLPENATYKTIEWTTSNPDVIEISDSGAYKAVGEGGAVISASCCDVIQEIPTEVFWIKAKSVSFNEESLAFSSPGKIKIDTAVAPVIEFVPANATLRDITLTSSDPSVLLVEHGQLFAVGTGSAIITATSPEAETSIEITVYDNSAAIGLGAVVLIGGSTFLVIRHKKNKAGFRGE